MRNTFVLALAMASLTQSLCAQEGTIERCYIEKKCYQAGACIDIQQSPEEDWFIRIVNEDNSLSLFKVDDDDRILPITVLQNFALSTLLVWRDSNGLNYLNFHNPVYHDFSKAFVWVQNDPPFEAIAENAVGQVTFIGFCPNLRP